MALEYSGVIASLPAKSFFSLPPYDVPYPQPPPAAGTAGLASPPLFTIPEDIFNAALNPKVPITIAAVYAVTVKLLNRYNRSTNKRPWAISKTRAFRFFVVLHNVFLAVYSAWTCYGMWRALKSSVANPSGPDGLAGTADSFCRISGAPGLGEGVYYDQVLGGWTSLSDKPALTSEGLPDVTTPGRLWNDGLAFYGWIFYLSKFYEVLDTLIILAKGKPSSTLQTYHHAGAMMAMWAGIRYMGNAIWIFVFVNAGIHAMMYTYYTVTALSIKVPTFIKRGLTTCQITQFLVGGSFAMSHSFISYKIPVAAPAASESESAPAATEQPAETTYVTQSCQTTDGGTFAVWLNVVYLAPLTYLFMRFFITSYLRRGTPAKRRMSSVERAEKAGWAAARGVEKEVYGGVSEDAIEDSDSAKSSGEANGKAKANGKANGKAKN